MSRTFASIVMGIADRSPRRFRRRLHPPTSRLRHPPTNRLEQVFERATETVTSTDGVDLVWYHANVAPESHSVQPSHPLLFSHATGFHGRVFTPIAERLTRFSCTTFDYRGFGDTSAPSNWTLSWDGFGDDALMMARHVSSIHAHRPIVGVGHSMGGAALIMAALREPNLFAALVVFEPIVFPPEVRSQAHRANPLADVTRRRRTTFGSFDEARGNFAAKPPLSSLHPTALDAYVRFGFTPSDDGVIIKCQPEFEARTYEMGAMHDTWNSLERLTVPTWVMTGAHAEHSPAAIATRIADLLPNGTLVEWRDRGHFGPLEDPVRFASFVADIADAAAR